MKINFDTIEKMVAAGASGAVVLAFLRAQYELQEPRRTADKMRKRAESCGNVGNVVDICGNAHIRTPDSQNKSSVVGGVTNEKFDLFWKAYPKRNGANPRAPAEKVFAGWVKGGDSADDIIAGAKAHTIAEPEKVGTQYIPQAVKWLRDRRWEDYLSSATSSEVKEINWDQVLTSYKQFGHWSRFAGPGPDSPACKAPPEMLEKYELRTQ